MDKLKNKLFALSWMLSIPLISSIYALLNNSSRGVHSLVTDIDRSIPFLQVFVVPYTSWYLFLFLTLGFLCFKDRSMYYKTVVTIDISLVLTLAIYFLYQTTVPRPLLAGDDLFTRLVALVYSYDQPFNAFPSIHSLTSFILLLAIKDSKARTWLNFLVISGSAITIILSTLFIKQHVVLDAIGAAILGFSIFQLVTKLKWESVQWWKPSLLLTMKRKLATSSRST